MHKIKNPVAFDTLHLLFLTLGVTFLIWLGTILWSRRKLYIFSWNVPGKLALPLLGHTYLLIGGDTAYYYKFAKELSKEYPQITKMWVGSKLYVSVAKPEHVEKMFTSPQTAEKDSFYDIMTELLGNGILTSPVKIWKPHRKALAPCMSQNVLNSYVEKFSECSINLVKKIEEYVGRKDVDWGIIGTRYAIEVFSKTMMGIPLDIPSDEPSDEDVGMILRHMGDIAISRFFTPIYHINAIWAVAPIKKVFDKYLGIYNHITRSCIKDKVLEDRQNPELKGKRQLDFLDLMLYKTDLTQDEIVAEVKTMLAGASDTTGLSLCSVFMMLGMHPDIQEKVYEEVIEVLGHDRAVEVSDLPLLKYTDRVIKETIRLFPAVTITARTVSDDLDLGSVVIPKGCSMVFVPSVYHRNPEYWKDPLKFDPDRFLPEESSKRHPCTYLPFAYGTRNCIGWKYGMMNLTTVTATVVRQFKSFTDYRSVEDLEIKLEPIIAFKEGIKLSFELRTPNQ